MHYYDEKRLKKIIWVYWKQGFDNAPIVVDRCLTSLKKNLSGWEINLLDGDNIKSYVDFPQNIWDSYYNKQIGEAHFSDLLRLRLLNKYGGCWVDSTCFFTGDIPDKIYDDGLFLFRNKGKSQDTINISNWFIYSAQNNSILLDTYNILEDYWGKETFAVQYYLFHLIFKLVTDKYEKEWSKKKQISNIPPHRLQMNLFEKYDLLLMADICEKSFVHKLTWKIENASSNGDFLEKILSDYIE